MRFRWPIKVRRVVGGSMFPALSPNKLVIGSSHFKLAIGSIVIIGYNDREIIKRVTKISQKEVFVVGDNKSGSTDSRSFGWLKKDSIVAKIIWPRV